MGPPEEQLKDELRETESRPALLLWQEHHPQDGWKTLRLPLHLQPARAAGIFASGASCYTGHTTKWQPRRILRWTRSIASRWDTSHCPRKYRGTRKWILFLDHTVYIILYYVLILHSQYIITQEKWSCVKWYIFCQVMQLQTEPLVVEQKTSLLTSILCQNFNFHQCAIDSLSSSSMMPMMEFNCVLGYYIVHFWCQWICS